MELRERFWERKRRDQERRRDSYLIACRFDAPSALVRLTREDLTGPSGSADLGSCGRRDRRYHVHIHQIGSTTLVQHQQQTSTHAL